MTKLGVGLTLGFVAFAAVGAWAWQQDAPKKGYIVAQIDVTNPQQYGEYMKLTPGLIQKFGGRFVARGGRSATLEGTPGQRRVVLIEFPTYEQAQAFYDSPEYQAAKKIRQGAATVQFVLVEGV